MSAKPWPKVVAQPMEPGGSEWAVVVDNATAPAHTWKAYAENLTEADAKRIALALNSLQPLRERLTERTTFACREACEIGEHVAGCREAVTLLGNIGAEAAVMDADGL